jgi:regulator of replication initiation timing
MKLKDAMNEWLDENKTLTKEQKRMFLEKVGSYNKFGEAIYSKHNLVEIAKELAEIARYAETLTISECGEKFDQITVGRNMKELKNLAGQFSKTAVEAQGLKERVSALYEEMGHLLQRYYKIDELEEQLGLDETALHTNADWDPLQPTKKLPSKGKPTVFPSTKPLADKIPVMDTPNLPKKGTAAPATKALPKKGGIPLKSATPKLP